MLKYHNCKHSKTFISMIWYYNHFFIYLEMETYHYLHLIILGWNTLFPKWCKTIKFSLEQSCPNYWKYEMLAMKSFWHLLSHVSFPSNIVFKMIKKCQNSGSSSIFPTPLKPLWNLSIFFPRFSRDYSYPLLYKSHHQQIASNKYSSIP